MKLNVFVDVTNAPDWMAIAGQIGTIFPGRHPRPWRPAIATQEDDPSKDIEKHFLIFDLDGALMLTEEQREFFKKHTYHILVV